MSDPYLLAAMLTGTPISGWGLAAPQPEQDLMLALLDSYEAEFLQSVPKQKIIPTVEIASPEFSQEFRPRKPTQKTEYSQPYIRKLASGSQLYYQRLAALKAGKIYTRLPFDSFKSSWIKATGKPTYEQWKRLLLREAKAIANGQGTNRLTILVGDSLSLWFPSEQLSEKQFWLNQGISGDTTAGILRRLSAFSQTRPDAIYIMAGINDLRRSASDRVILNNHRQIIRRLRSYHPQARIVIQSILPTRLATISNNRIRLLNAQLASIAQKEGATYLNLHDQFTDFEGNLRQELTTDGLHLSDRGYEVWQQALSSD